MKITYNKEGIAFATVDQPLLNMCSEFNENLLLELGVKEIIISYTIDDEITMSQAISILES